MPRSRSWTDEQFKAAVDRASSWNQVARLLGLKEGGGVQETILRRVVHLDLNVSHLPATLHVASEESTERIAIGDEELKVAISLSRSWAEVLRRLERTGGGTQGVIKQRAERLGLDVSYFLGQGWNRGRRFGPKRSPEEVLVLRDPDRVKESSYILRRALLAVGVPYRCAVSRPSGMVKCWSCL